MNLAKVHVCAYVHGGAKRLCKESIQKGSRMAVAPHNFSSPALEEEAGRTEIIQSLVRWTEDLKETVIVPFLSPLLGIFYL